MNLRCHFKNITKGYTKHYYAGNDRIASKLGGGGLIGLDMPCSEDWPNKIDQRTTGWNTMYSFSGKERDEESNYSYFGARYYNSDISLWLSVDPRASSYPSLTPYAYCANSPVMYRDPNGESINWWQGLLIGVGLDMFGGGAISSTILTTGITSYATLFPFTSVGYEIQKYISPVAVQFSFGFGSSNHLGIDASFGLMKGFGFLPSYRWHGGTSYRGGNNPYGGSNGWETRTGAEFSIGNKYYTGLTANDPTQRAGVLSFGFGPIRIGRNSENIRHIFQNRFAHDFLMNGQKKEYGPFWFQQLDIDPSWYFYFGTGNGNTLW